MYFGAPIATLRWTRRQYGDCGEYRELLFFITTRTFTKDVRHTI